MDTQYRKNLKAVLNASKSYTDSKIEDLKWELGTYDLSITTDSTTAYTKTIPTNAIKGRLNYIGGASKVSENLIVLNDVAETTTNGITYSVSNGVITLNGTSTATFSLTFSLFLTINGAYVLAIFNNQILSVGNVRLFHSNNGGNVIVASAVDFTTTNNSKSFTNTNSGVGVAVSIPNETTFNNFVIKPMLVSGSTAPTTWKQGFENIRSAKTTSVVVSGTDVAPITKAIPQEVLNDVRYGLGFSDTQFNKLDLITKHLTGEWNIVDLGSLNWNVDGDHLFSTTINLAKNSAICVMGSNQYNLDTNVTITDKEYKFGGSSNTFYVRDYSISTTSDFKTAMSGVYLLYQTATQFDVDFSQYIGDDFKNIDTTDMTTATFENEFGYDVPSEIDYLIEEVKA